MSETVDTPIEERLRWIPTDFVLETEMRDNEGSVYGHSRIAVGYTCHKAASLIEQQAAEIERLQIRLGWLRL